MLRSDQIGADPMKDAETVADALRDWSNGEIKVRSQDHCFLFFSFGVRGTELINADWSVSRRD
jgi:hypothetical protein